MSAPPAIPLSPVLAIISNVCSYPNINLTHCDTVHKAEVTELQEAKKHKQVATTKHKADENEKVAEKKQRKRVCSAAWPAGSIWINGSEDAAAKAYNSTISEMQEQEFGLSKAKQQT